MLLALAAESQIAQDSMNSLISGMQDSRITALVVCSEQVCMVGSAHMESEHRG